MAVDGQRIRIKVEREVSHRDIARLISLRMQLAQLIHNHELGDYVNANHQRAIGRAATRLALSIVGENLPAGRSEDEPRAVLMMSETEADALDRGRLAPEETVDKIGKPGQAEQYLSPGSWQLWPGFQGEA